MSDCVVGVFVGGRSRRLGGIPKGLLKHPVESGSLVERALSMGRRVGSEVVLVGKHEAYEGLGVRMLADAPAGVGPIGGLAALLAHAGERDAIAIACDMPFVPIELVERLVATSGGAAVVPRRAGGLEPLCTLYRPDALRETLADAIARRSFSLQSVLARVELRELVLAEDEQRWLDDWDAPADLVRP
ncbi:MAG: molybdenum cofactor guanylyltransferase [Deltaproteobacteria bacterium]|nr:molybdenum cofactor guanylyltransferase [Deltaproteobacteria bacterium]